MPYFHANLTEWGSSLQVKNLSVCLFVCLFVITSRFQIKALYIIPGSRLTPHIIYCCCDMIFYWWDCISISPLIYLIGQASSGFPPCARLRFHCCAFLRLSYTETPSWPLPYLPVMIMAMGVKRLRKTLSWNSFTFNFPARIKMMIIANTSEARHNIMLRGVWREGKLNHYNHPHYLPSYHLHVRVPTILACLERGVSHGVPDLQVST